MKPLRRRWIKVWTQELLYGTTSKELTLEEQAVWVKFLALAGDSPVPGIVCLAPDVPYPLPSLAKVIGTETDILEHALKKMVEVGKVTINDGVIHISNWGKYQEFDRVAYMREYMENYRRKSTPKSTKEEDVEKRVYLSRLQDILTELTVRGKKEKLGLLVEEFSFHHSKAPPEDFENLGGCVAGLLKQVSNDYGYLAKIIWDTSSASIAGSHLNYIQGILRKDKPKRDIRDLPSEEEIKQSVKEFKGG